MFSIGESKADGIAILFFHNKIKFIRICEVIPGRLAFADIYYCDRKIRIMSIQHKIWLGKFCYVTEEQDRIATKPCQIRREGTFLKSMMIEHKFNNVFMTLFLKRMDFTR